MINAFKKNKEHKIKAILLKWYKNNHRELPWRKLNKNNLPDPYFILISEFMLQQTTVNTVIPKFNIFVKSWPNIKFLKKSRESTILKFWSGLGYYSRARNLLKTAKIISKKYNHLIPEDYNSLINLPGIGDYTAKAIMGIAYNKPVMPLDTNIKRIISRLNGIKISNKLIDIDLINNSKKFISIRNSSNFIQSLMDYGSKICLSQKPRCNECVISTYCYSYNRKIINYDIIKIKKPKKIKFSKFYIVFNSKNEFLVRRRSSKGMLASMLEIPNTQWVENINHVKDDEITKIILNKFQNSKIKINYSFSHFDLEVKICYTKIKKIKIKNYSWIAIRKIPQSGMPTLMKKIVNALVNSIKG